MMKHEDKEKNISRNMTNRKPAGKGGKYEWETRGGMRNKVTRKRFNFGKFGA